MFDLSKYEIVMGFKEVCVVHKSLLILCRWSRIHDVIIHSFLVTCLPVIHSWAWRIVFTSWNNDPKHGANSLSLLQSRSRRPVTLKHISDLVSTRSCYVLSSRYFYTCVQCQTYLSSDGHTFSDGRRNVPCYAMTHLFYSIICHGVVLCSVLAT